MKKTAILFAFILNAGLMNGQNLVPNPSFEDTTSCPDNLSQIDRAFGWQSYRITPDYFNACSLPGGYSGVPLNQFDYQYPRSGNAYAGLFCLYLPTLNAREYIGIELSQPLIIGREYFASFFVNRASDTSLQHKNIATNKIGLRMSTIAYSPLTSNGKVAVNNSSAKNASCLDCNVSRAFLTRDSHRF